LSPTFNINAVASNSPFRATVLGGDGARYGKNSVDIVVEDMLKTADLIGGAI